MSSQDILFNLNVPDAHPCYAGHFSGNPIAPGAVLLTWFECELVKRNVGQIKTIKQVKFYRPATPGLKLACQVTLKGSQLKFAVMHETEILFSGSAELL